MSLKRVWVNFPIDEAPLAPEARSADMLSAVGAATFCRPHRLRTECPPAVSLQNACAPDRAHVPPCSSPAPGSGAGKRNNLFVRIGRLAVHVAEGLGVFQVIFAAGFPLAVA